MGKWHPALVLLSMAAGCASEDAPAADAGGVGLQLTGMVRDVGSAGPVQGVTVRVGEASAVTDAAGNFALEADGAGPWTLRLTRDGYCAAQRTIRPSGSGITTISVDLQLKRVDRVVTIDPATGGTVVNDRGASVAIPAGGIVDRSGNAPAEAIEVELTSFDTSTAEVTAAAGEMNGKTVGGATVSLTALGIVAVVLRGRDSRQIYRLDQASAAEIAMPLAGDPARAPDTVPIWHFDDDAGVWAERGQAAKSGRTYRATVEHFSDWSAAEPARETSCITGLVRVDDAPAASLQVQLTAVGFQATAVTDVDGRFRFEQIPGGAGVPVTLSLLGVQKTVITAAGECQDVGVIEPPALPQCGDGVLSPGETCDGVSLGGAQCWTVGFDSGVLACTANCAYDTSGCGTCQNGTLDGSEACDGALLGDQTCETVGDFVGGVLGCTTDCLLDLTGCVAAPPDAGPADLGLDGQPDATRPTDATPTDAGVPRDSGLPDTATGVDAGTDGALDSQVVADGADDAAGDAAPQCDPAKIGLHCTAATEATVCGPGNLCAVISQSWGGFCSCACTPDDPKTAVTDEDTCPAVATSRCHSLTLWDGADAELCLRHCQPRLQANDCDAPLACLPTSTAISGDPQQAVCADIGCQSDEDCPVTTPTPCSTSTDCSAGQSCGPAGLCTEPGLCDQLSGLCAAHATDQPGAQIGDPCDADRQCGAYMKCELEIDRVALGQLDHGQSCISDSDCCGDCVGGLCSGTCVVHARQGYCTMLGCAFGATLSAFSCPAGSSCYLLENGGACLKNCALDDPATCRGQVADLAGDYECRAWNALTLGGTPITEAPVCQYGDAVRCDFFGAPSSLDCSALGAQMVCRGLDGRAIDPDASGFCFDHTASAPSGSWPACLPQSEICNAIDDDCDDVVDEGC